MTDQELYDAIHVDSTALALAHAGDDAGVAARIAATHSVPARYLPVTRLIYWGALTGVRAKMQVAADDNTSPVQSLAISYMDMIRAAGSPGLDTSDPAIVGTGGMLDAFAQAGVFAASGVGSKADLLAQVASDPVSVGVGDVSRVLYQDRPNGRIS